MTSDTLERAPFTRARICRALKARGYLEVVDVANILVGIDVDPDVLSAQVAFFSAASTVALSGQIVPLS